MHRSRKASVAWWTKVFQAALEDAEAKRPELERNRARFLNRLNKQANRIREWDLGSTDPAKPMGGSGFRLLP